MAWRLDSGAAETVDEQQAVGQSGQRVVDRLVRESLTARLALRDVLDVGHHVDRLGVRVADQRHRNRHPDRGSVDVQVPHLELERVDVAGDEAVDRVDEVRTIIRVRQADHRRTEQLVLGSPEHLREGAVHAEEAAVGLGEAHADRRMLERVAESLLRGRNSSSRAVALGHVARVDDEPGDRRIPEQVVGNRLQRSPRAVALLHAELDGFALSGALLRLREGGDDPVAVVGVDHLERRRTEQLLVRSSEETFGRRGSRR